jgi:hypothetical protein
MMTGRCWWALVSVPPVCAAGAWIAVLTIAGVTDRHPVWNLTPRNVAEAAAFRDGAAVVRFVLSGSNLNASGDVRAGIIRSEAAVLTPVEAAAAARQAEMLQLLMDLGASPDASVWQRAYCISDADSVREVLAKHRPAGAAEDCDQH